MGFRRRTIILLLIFLEFFGPKLSVSAQGCSVGEGGPISALIKDTHEGIIFDLQTTGITGIEQYAYSQNIISPPYVDMAFDNSRFVMRTNERFSLYEENEIEESIVIIVRFRCSSNNHLDVTTTIHLHDTNNHAPRFIPTDHYHYVLDAPVPPGYQVTGCLSELIARDVDLTTERIIFDIQQNPFFGITYSAELSDNRSKEFIAIVTTKTFIRNLPEEMTLTITATDVHGTEGEGSQTTSGKITIIGNTNFVLPNEPVFSKTIYNGIYTAAGQVELEEFISLQNGYDDLVLFSVEETYKINFRLVKLPDQVNQIMIEVLVPLEEDILLQGSIAIEIIAEREFTSGASATVILQLPQVDPVQFESAHYDGTIENNNLLLSPLKLSQGYKDSVVTASFVETGKFTMYFTNYVN
ncbi:unnamed protein product [Spodoptera littoralis]|uniref:Cadherin domain-containing protein n=1 Tax=Spodoptera littoralis TaxID=7109 RepID=A0A9P0IEF2_SPOLI|nr:unnamed protein product [Spodoptera littoralis]CAH1644326.1 unnamed protein product [Spodoptera littoralis]